MKNCILFQLLPSLSMNDFKICFFWFSFCVFFTGQSGHTSRQFFPYVSSESDLQHYKTISFRHSHNHEHRASSSLSNVPSDFRSDRIKVCQKAHQFKSKWKLLCILWANKKTEKVHKNVRKKDVAHLYQFFYHHSIQKHILLKYIKFRIIWFLEFADIKVYDCLHVCLFIEH